MILEGEDFLKYLYETEISEMGFEILTARNSYDAIRVLRFDTPELLLVDLAFPEMDDLSLLNIVWQEKPGLPFIIYAAYSNYRTNILNILQKEFTSKYFDLNECKEAIHWILKRGHYEKFRSYRMAEFGIRSISQW